MYTEETKNQLYDLLEHKSYMLIACNKMCKILFELGHERLAYDLVKRALVHDNSKIENDEIKHLSKIKKSNKSLVDADYELTEHDIICIREHWKNNRHHPEYFDNQDDMKTIDIIEMVCDWYARSLQFNTDFMDFVYKRQDNRFKFSNKQYKIVLYYCNLINNGGAFDGSKI